MERPSHIIFDQNHSWLRRTSVIALAIGLQLAGFWLFAHGLKVHVPDIIHDAVFVPTPVKDVPPVKPPEPDITKKLKVIEIPPPAFGTEQPSRPGDGGIRGTLQTSTDTGTTKPPENILHAAVAIMSTHTVPPYPPIARRLGAEGKVTLRLTVSPEGRVTRAEVVTSSGRDELDQAAQAWIVAHWAYKPALDNGASVSSQVLTIVTFSLANDR